MTSAIVVTMRQSAVYTGTLQQLERTARSVLTHNLLLGWWGFPWGLIRTPMALSANSSAMQRVRALASQPPGVAGPPMQGQPWQPPPQQGQPWQPPHRQGQPWQPPPQPGQPWQPPPQQGQPWQPPPQPGQPWQPPPPQGPPWQGQPPQR